MNKPNIKFILAKLEIMPPHEQEWLLRYHTALTEAGFDVPSGIALKRMLKERKDVEPEEKGEE